MSPEQAGGEPVDHRSDLFSLGSVLYAMCTGRPPFRAETTFGVLRRIRETSPRPIREINADIPEWLERIVSKLLAKEPADRIATAEEVADLAGAMPGPRPATDRRGSAPRRRVGCAHQRLSFRWAQPTLHFRCKAESAACSAGNASIFNAPEEWPPQQAVRALGFARLRAGRGDSVHMYWKGHSTQSSPDDSLGHLESQSAATDPAMEWNAVQFAFDAVETELAPFESEMQSALDDLETEFSPPFNSGSGDNP